MKYLRILEVFPLALTLILFNTSVKTMQDSEAARSLAQLELKWIADFQRRDPTLLENILADDFVYTSEIAILNKREFIARAEKLELGERKIELDNSRMRVYGSAAVSTGSIVLRSQVKDQIKGNSGVAAKSAVVNLGEMQEKQPSSSGERRIVPSPMPVPRNRPVPAIDAQYRYTAIYVKLYGRWRLAALHLSRVVRE